MKRTTPNASGCLLILSLAHLILYSSHQSDYCKKAVYILIYCINMRGINEFSWCEWAQFGYNSNFYVLILYLLIFIFLQSFSLVLFWTWLLLKFLDSEYISVIYCAHLLKFRTTTLVVYFLIDFIFFFNFWRGNSTSHLTNMLKNKLMEMPHFPENRCYNSWES